MMRTTRLGVPAFLLTLIARAGAAGSRSSLDETTLSPAERRFIHDDVEGHNMDAVVQGTFGGGDPNRLLDFPPAR
jgi:hypothetical protein